MSSNLDLQEAYSLNMVSIFCRSSFLFWSWVFNLCISWSLMCTISCVCTVSWFIYSFIYCIWSIWCYCCSSCRFFALLSPAEIWAWLWLSLLKHFAFDRWSFFSTTLLSRFDPIKLLERFDIFCIMTAELAIFAVWMLVFICRNARCTSRSPWALDLSCFFKMMRLMSVFLCRSLLLFE